MKKALLLLPLIAVIGCAPMPGQNRYNMADVGKNVELEEARVLRVKEVDITGQQTGVGAGAGMATGMVAGSHIGDGRGQLLGIIAGAVIGGIAGSIAEQEMQNMKGYEYRVKTKSGKIKSIVQHQNKDDIVFQKGAKVLIQTSGQYQRVVAYE